MSFRDRYHEVGLDRNPFAARSSVDQPALTFVDRGIPAPPPPGSLTLIQVIGDSGMGKSAHLNHWRTQTPGPFHYVPRASYRARWRTPPVGAIVYGDEIDRMPKPIRHRWLLALAEADATVVIGTHVDLRTAGERAGFTVLSHWLSPLDEPTLAHFLSQQLAAAAIDDQFPDFTPGEVAEIFAASNGNPGRAEVEAHRVLASLVHRTRLTESEDAPI